MPTSGRFYMGRRIWGVCVGYFISLSNQRGCAGSNLYRYHFIGVKNGLLGHRFIVIKKKDLSSLCGVTRGEVRRGFWGGSRYPLRRSPGDHCLGRGRRSIYKYTYWNQYFMALRSMGAGLKKWGSRAQVRLKRQKRAVPLRRVGGSLVRRLSGYSRDRTGGEKEGLQEAGKGGKQE